MNGKKKWVANINKQRLVSFVIVRPVGVVLGRTLLDQLKSLLTTRLVMGLVHGYVFYCVSCLVDLKQIGINEFSLGLSCHHSSPDILSSSDVTSIHEGCDV